MNLILFFYFLTNCSVAVATFASRIRLYERIAIQFNNSWNLISCDSNINQLGSLMKQSPNLLAYQTQKFSETLQGANTIWDYDSCSGDINSNLLQEIDNFPIYDLWIAIHENDKHIFPSKLHQNIIHFSQETEEFIEHKKYPNDVNKIEKIGNLQAGILNRIKIDDILHNNL